MKSNENVSDVRNHSVPQAAELLGIGERTMWKLIHNREIEHTRIGKRVLISSTALDAFLKKKTIPVFDRDSVRS